MIEVYYLAPVSSPVYEAMYTKVSNVGYTTYIAHDLDAHCSRKSVSMPKTQQVSPGPRRIQSVPVREYFRMVLTSAC